MKRHTMKTYNLYLLFILLLTVSCKKLDRYENAIIRSKSVDYYVDGAQVSFSADSIKKATKDYMKTFKPKDISKLLSDDDVKIYSNRIHKEVNEWRWTHLRPINRKDLENFQIEYYYDGYLYYGKFSSITMEIFADKNKTVSYILLDERTPNWNFKETLLFKDDEILSIYRCYSYPRSEGFLHQTSISWTHEYETLYFKGNRFHKRIVGSKKRDEGYYQVKDMLEKEGARKYEKYIRKSYYLRKLAQTIINDKAMDCRKSKSLPLGINSCLELTDFFNENADIEVLKSIEDPTFAFVEQLRVKINSKGETDTVIVVFPIDHIESRREYRNNDEYFKIVYGEITRIIHKIKWQPATENCQAIDSEKDFFVDFNNIYDNIGNKSPKKYKNTKNFSVAVQDLPQY